MSIANKSKCRDDWDFFALNEIPCPGDCNHGLPCLYCGSSGQHVGTVKTKELVAGKKVRLYALSPTARVRETIINVCGMCADFGPKGCMTSTYEAKFGNANTPACDEFKRKV